MSKAEKTAKSSIILIGMMATGKSTVGRALARELGWEFFDSDKEVEMRSGVSISEIFEKESEAGFRVRETKVLADLTTKPGVVIATGGGAPLFDVNQKILQRGFVIQLSTTVSDILERTQFDATRPLLQAEDKVARIRDLMLVRTPVYDAVCQEKITTTRVHPRAIVEKILNIEAVRDVVEYAEKLRQQSALPEEETRND